MCIRDSAKTGQVRSAFVSEEPFLDYAGEDGDPTNVNDRREAALWEKEQGYYGVDYTGSLPERVEDQTLSVRIVKDVYKRHVYQQFADPDILHSS